VKITNQVDAVEMCFIEVQGQLKENGSEQPLFKDAVRSLSEAVSMLEELIDGRN
jgi:hypothetical protein